MEEVKRPLIVITKYFFVYVLMSLVILWFFRCIIMLSPIPSGSMESTIMTGDLVISSRLNTEELERYDIVVFDAPDTPNKKYIKRIIGLPGEEIVVKDGEVFADGELLDDSFVNDGMSSEGDGVYNVPDNCLFMMGDNRNDSLDSRYWEHKYVPIESVNSKAILDVSFDHIKLLKYKPGQ